MKLVLLWVVGSLLFISFSGCSGCGYKDRDSFKSENIEKRKDIYKLILKDQKMDNINDALLLYLDHIITESASLQTIQKQNPIDNFSKFLEIAVPLLYCSYSPANYENAPKGWKEKATRFIVEFPPYYLNYGEDKYRAWRKEMIGSTNTIIAFPYYNSNSLFDLVHAGGYYAKDSVYKLMVYSAWGDVYDYSDFLSLNTDSQSMLMRIVAEQVMIKRGYPVNEVFISAMDNIQDYWKKNSSAILKRTEFASLKGNTPAKSVLYSVLLAVIEDLKLSDKF